MKRKRNGFTLLELIAVLVIMAIIALIATPLVMSIIRKARVSADKRSIDAYGRSIELAIAGYLLDTGKFQTDVSQLTIEYSGNKVECETTQINTDSSVYLAGCAVNGRSVDNYTYGKEEMITYDEYEIGDQVTYNNVDYRVIKNSSASESTVTLLKAEPLTTEEVNLYGAGHVNKYTRESMNTAYDSNGYGGVAYYTSDTCGYVNNNWVYDGCTTDYAQSDVKYIVDSWANAKVQDGLQEARLITKEEIDNYFAYEEYDAYPCGESCGIVEKRQRINADWMYDSKYYYWTMSIKDNLTNTIWNVTEYGGLGDMNLYYGSFYPGQVVRPVIVLDKSVL